MTRPRKISSLIARVLAEDPRAPAVDYDGIRKRLFVKLTSRLAWSNLLEEVEVPVVDKFELTVVEKDGSRGQRFCVTWDCDDIPSGEIPPVRGFSFDRRGAEKRARRRVREQEDEGARIIGGERHVGSGAISDLKSDASSEEWQQESKQTAAKSFRLTLDVLEKITREARTQGKKPMVFLRFTDIPEEMVVEEDWAIVPKSCYEEMAR